MAKDLPGTHYHPVAGWLRPSEGERISSNTKPLSPNRWMFGSTKHRQESLRMAGTPWMFYLSPWEKLSNMSMVLTGPHLGKTLLFNVANPHLIYTETKTTSVVLAQKLRGESAFVHPESPPARIRTFISRSRSSCETCQTMISWYPWGCPKKLEPQNPVVFWTFS
jgi:hypothetical protein